MLSFNLELNLNPNLGLKTPALPSSVVLTSLQLLFLLFHSVKQYTIYPCKILMIELFNMVKIKQLSAGDLRVSTALKENQSYILQQTLGSLYQSSSRASYTSDL